MNQFFRSTAKLRFQLHNFFMVWAMTLLIMLEDDAAMLAFMLS